MFEQYTGAAKFAMVLEAKLGMLLEAKVSILSAEVIWSAHREVYTGKTHVGSRLTTTAILRAVPGMSTTNSDA